jgi:hypothetical protein
MTICLQASRSRGSAVQRSAAPRSAVRRGQPDDVGSTAEGPRQALPQARRAGCRLPPICQTAHTGNECSAAIHTAHDNELN